jgi:hypothetical protein
VSVKVVVRSMVASNDCLSVTSAWIGSSMRMPACSVVQDSVTLALPPVSGVSAGVAVKLSISTCGSLSSVSAKAPSANPATPE